MIERKKGNINQIVQTINNKELSRNYHKIVEE